jgi:hypothetical protein
VDGRLWKLGTIRCGRSNHQTGAVLGSTTLGKRIGFRPWSKGIVKPMNTSMSLCSSSPSRKRWLAKVGISRTSKNWPADFKWLESSLQSHHHFRSHSRIRIQRGNTELAVTFPCNSPSCPDSRSRHVSLLSTLHHLLISNVQISTPPSPSIRWLFLKLAKSSTSVSISKQTHHHHQLCNSQPNYKWLHLAVSDCTSPDSRLGEI